MICSLTNQLLRPVERPGWKRYTHPEGALYFTRELPVRLHHAADVFHHDDVISRAALNFTPTLIYTMIMLTLLSWNMFST
jgi:hypothetical protein